MTPIWSRPCRPTTSAAPDPQCPKPDGFQRLAEHHRTGDDLAVHGGFLLQLDSSSGGLRCANPPYHADFNWLKTIRLPTIPTRCALTWSGNKPAGVWHGRATRSSTIWSWGMRGTQRLKNGDDLWPSRRWSITLGGLAGDARRPTAQWTTRRWSGGRSRGPKSRGGWFWRWPGMFPTRRTISNIRGSPGCLINLGEISIRRCTDNKIQAVTPAGRRSGVLDWLGSMAHSRKTTLSRKAPAG